MNSDGRTRLAHDMKHWPQGTSACHTRCSKSIDGFTEQQAARVVANNQTNGADLILGKCRKPTKEQRQSDAKTARQGVRLKPLGGQRPPQVEQGNTPYV